MKELKFTPENFRRHFVNSPRVIWTVRDKKLNFAEPVVIKSPSPLMREFIFKVHSIETYLDIEYLAHEYWELEGFKSETEFLEELLRIYPNADFLYAHMLIEVVPKTGNRCFDCKYFSESVLYTSITDNDFWNYCLLRKTTTKRHYSCTSFIKEDEL